MREAAATNQEELLDQLRGTLSRMELALDAVSEAIVLMDLAGRIQWCNGAFDRLIGKPRIQIIGGWLTTVLPLWQRGMPLLDTTHPLHPLNRLQSGERSVSAEYEVRVAGAILAIEIQARSIQTTDKESTVVVVVRDISERRKMEEGLRMQRLAALNVAQDAEEARRETQRTAEELERSNRELEQMAYVASHDLQEPLRMVASYVGLLEKRYKGKLDGDADKFIHYAVDGATRMKQLINDLLEYSRVGMRLKPFTPVPGVELVDEALDRLKQAIEDAGGKIIRDPLPTVLGDRGQLVQLFQNLIGNAIKYRKKEEPLCIHISSVKREGAWEFTLQDNGIGIDPRHAEQIFAIFQRLHTREEYPGTGIGLAVCKRIVERHQGRIWVESQIGRGSKFCFTIPSSVEEENNEHSQVA